MTPPNLPSRGEEQSQLEAPFHRRLPRWAWWLIIALPLIAVLGAGFQAWMLQWRANINTQAPVHQAATEPTADWQTYRNTEYGFEVKYPASWSVNEDNQPTYSTVTLGGNNFHVGVSSQLVKETDVCDKYYEKKAEVKIGSQKNTWCLDGNPDDRWGTFVNNDAFGIVFYCWFPETKNNLDVCNQILSTFKFIEPTK